VIDFNPVTLEELKAKGVHGLFGDISSLDTLEHAHLSRASAIVSTIPDMLLKGVDNFLLTKMCKAIAPSAILIATGDDEKHEQQLRSEGANFVLRPYDLAGDQLGKFLQQTPKPLIVESEELAAAAT